MAQPKPMMGTVYHASSSRQKMMGRFIRTPMAREYSGYDWRTSSPAYKRFKKQALSQFRRRDGKRWVLEGLAATYEEQASYDGDEQERLRQERYDSGLDYDDRFQEDYGCSCCGEYYDDRFHDGVDYSAEAEYAREVDNEAAYQQDMAELEWVEDWYGDYTAGFRAGYKQAMKDLQRRHQEAS